MAPADENAEDDEDEDDEKAKHLDKLNRDIETFYEKKKEYNMEKDKKLAKKEKKR